MIKWVSLTWEIFYLYSKIETNILKYKDPFCDQVKPLIFLHRDAFYEYLKPLIFFCEDNIS